MWPIPTDSDFLFSFLLHTYLVKAWSLKNDFGHNARPALHSAESSIVQYPSGSWFAEFLIASSWMSSFHCDRRLARRHEEAED